MKPINREFTPEVGMALATKNGQSVGNGFIVDVEVKTFVYKKSILNETLAETLIVYHIITDFGNVIKMTHNEVLELYDVAEWWWEMEERYLNHERVLFDHRSFKDRLDRQIELLNELKENYCGE